MRALRLRARAKEVDAVVLTAVQTLCNSWWSRWSVADVDGTPVALLQVLGSGENDRRLPEDSDIDFAEMDSEGMGYALALGDSSAMLKSALGQTIQDPALRNLLAKSMFQDLVDGLRRISSVQASAKVLDSRVLSGPAWNDPRTSARQFAIELNGSILAWGRLSAAAVDVLGPEPAGTSCSSKSGSTLADLPMISAACEAHLHLDGLKWSDLAHCKAGDLLLGSHGLEAPVTLFVEGRPAPLSMQLHDMGGEWSVRIN